MNLKTNRPLQIGLFFIDLVIITVVLYEITIFWLGSLPQALGRSTTSNRLDMSSSIASSALELVTKRREFNYISTGRRDPFSSLLIPPRPKKPAPAPQIKKIVPKPVKPSVQLKGILWEEKEPLAFLDCPAKRKTQVVRVGDKIDNYKVVEITKDSLTLTNGQLKFVLKLKESSLSGSNP